MFILGELIVWAFFCTVFVSYEKGYFAFWTTAILSVGLWFAGFNVFTWAWDNPKLLAQGLFVYILAGIVWATFKFVVKLRKARNKYIADKKEYFRSNPRITDEAWIAKIKGSYGGTENYAPTVNQNKENIMFWAWWWPFSVIGFFFEDLIVELWNMSWNFMKGFLNGIRSTVLGEAAKDLDDVD